MNDDFRRFFYRETVRRSGVADGRVIRRTGVGDEYAHVRVLIHPLARGQGNVLAWNAESNIPAKFASFVIQGLQAVMTRGAPGGFELTDVHASVESGSYHETDSNGTVFKEAAEKATEQALRQAQPVLLEAVVSITVSIPEEFTGAVQETVNACGQVMHTMTVDDGMVSLTAEFSATQAGTFIEQVLTITQGRAHIGIVISGFVEARSGPEPPEDWEAVT
jgi:elongation factor G